MEEDARRQGWFGAVRRAPVIGHLIRLVECIYEMACFIAFALQIDREDGLL